MPYRSPALFALALALCGCGDSSQRATTAAPGAPASRAGDSPNATPAGATSGEMAATIAKAMALPEPQPIDLDPCALLTADDATPYFSDPEPPKEKGGTEQHPFRVCQRNGGTMGMSSVLLAVAGGLDAERFDALMKGQAELADQVGTMQAIDGVGDRAYWLSDFLWVQAGGTTFYVSISTIPALADAAALDGSLQLAQSVLGRLSLPSSM